MCIILKRKVKQADMLFHRQRNRKYSFLHKRALPERRPLSVRRVRARLEDFFCIVFLAGGKLLIDALPPSTGMECGINNLPANNNNTNKLYILITVIIIKQIYHPYFSINTAFNNVYIDIVWRYNWFASGVLWVKLFLLAG